MSTDYLCSKYEWALTEPAREFVSRLEQNGVDRDLALSILELALPESEIYDLGRSDG